MTPEQITEILETANQSVIAKKAKALTEIEYRILEQVLQGKSLSQIKIPGYADTTVQRVFCPKLWELLSEVVGEKIRLNTVHLTLENLFRQSKQKQSAHARFEILESEQTISNSLDLTKSIRHNLPAPSCTEFIGREGEINRLLGLLSPTSGAHLISVDGIGGVGKTSLVVECAYRCLRAGASRDFSIPTFDIIIFVSAKQFYLTPWGFLKSLSPRRTLQDVFRQISRILGDDIDITCAEFNEQIDLIKDALARQRTLIIVDNLETVTEQEEVIAFLYELPSTVKAIITTREQIIFSPVRLSCMTREDSLRLIRHEAKEKQFPIVGEDCNQLYQATGGVPVAITYAIGQLANGCPLPEVIERLSHPTGDVARFCFESSISLLRGEAAHQLFMTLTLFPISAHQEALTAIAVPNADPEKNRSNLAQLRGLSLVKQENNRYSILPLTREYALGEIRANSNFEQQVKERWVNWYLTFSNRYAKQTAHEWQGQFDGLEEEWSNFQAVMDWCMTEERYLEVLTFWQNLEAYTRLKSRQSGRHIYFDDRLTWTAWLLNMARHKADWETAVKVMLERAWTFILIGKPQQFEEASCLLHEALKLVRYQNPLMKVDLLKHLAVLHIQKQEFDMAKNWLQQSIRLLEQLPLEQEESRQLAQLQYYQGEIYFKTGNYHQAKIAFQASLANAQATQWLRLTFLIQNWLADIAIVTKQNLNEAETLLMNGLQVAASQQDQTRIAYCKRSMAELEQARGRLHEAHHWASEAFRTFEKIGMYPEAEETQQLLQCLEKPSEK
ncbi:NB-ARC domain-containing protein [Leptolyngbya sp. AN03gr2]|uniref:tetratricopeptide repeat protein n=1 Tax=unclassified Leptolyngbya TaxID=2650499 RepID=UPI003D30F5DA